MIANQQSRDQDADATTIFRFFNEIGIIAQLSQNIFESVMPNGFTLSQFSVLNHFVRLKRIESPARLARAFQVTRGAMTNTLSRLEKAGYIAIAPDPDDGRAKLVNITGQGVAAHNACIAELAPTLGRLATDIDVATFANALPALEDIRKYLDSARNSPD